MKPVLIIIHVFVCVTLILIVLFQRGKGADMGAVFGGSSQAIFGTRGATTLLHKLTTIIAIVFMLTSLGLSIFISRAPSRSVMEGVKAPAAQKSLPAPDSQEKSEPSK